MLAEPEEAGAAPETDREPAPRSVWGRCDATLRRWWPDKRPQWEPFGEPTASWWPDIALVLAFAAITGALLWPSPLVHFDVAVRDYFMAHQPGWAFVVARAFTYLGQGTPLAFGVLILSAWCARRFGSIRPLLLYAASYLTLGFVLGLKNWLDRVAPRFPDQAATVDADGATLFSQQHPATSYPSGHAANAVLWYALAVMLIGAALTVTQRRLLLAAPPLLLVASQTYLGYHWLSDAPAGFIIGVLIIRNVKRVRWGSMPLGPLSSFEPASPGTTTGMAALLGGVLLAGMMPGYGLYIGCAILVIGVAWLVIRRRRVA